MFWLGSSSANRLGQLPIIQFVILISQCNIEFEVNSSGRFSSFASHHQKNIRHNGVVDCVFMMLALLAVFYVRFINIDYLIEIFFLNCLLWLRLLSLFVSACVCVCVIRPVPADKRWSDCSNIREPSSPNQICVKQKSYCEYHARVTLTIFSRKSIKV